MQYAHPAAMTGITHTAQEGYGDRRISSMGMVVGLHALIAVMLYTGLTRTPLLPPQKPTILTIVPDIPPPPVTPIVPPRDRPLLTRQIDLPVPPVSDPAPTPPVPIDMPTIGDPLAQIDNTLRSSDPPTTGNGQTIAQPPAVGLVCPNVKAVQAGMRYPPAALRDGVQGEVMVRFVLTAGGQIRNAQVVSATPMVLNRAALTAVRELQCMGQAGDITVDAPFLFRLTD